MNLSTVPEDVQVIETMLQSHRIYCIASGESEGVMKFYLYSLGAEKEEYFVELQIFRKTKTLQANIKGTNQNSIQAFKNFFEYIVSHQLK